MYKYSQKLNVEKKVPTSPLVYSSFLPLSRLSLCTKSYFVVGSPLNLCLQVTIKAHLWGALSLSSSIRLKFMVIVKRQKL